VNKILKNIIIKSVGEVISEAGGDCSGLNIYLENTKERKFGDWSLNTALRLAKQFKKSPFEIAEIICSGLKEKIIKYSVADKIKNIEIKAPGFINIFLADSAFYDLLNTICLEKDRFGSCVIGKEEKVLLEFVSANPTGPLSIAHARQAAVGDTLANILKFCGYNVTKEYYINDQGNQIKMLGLSLRARYLEKKHNKIVNLPADGYKGQYLSELSECIIKEEKASGKTVDIDNLDFFSEYAAEKILRGIKTELTEFGVEFDCWFSQKELSASGAVLETLKKLEENNYTYQKDGAVWFKSTDFGDDKDRVLVKSDQQFTYLTPDLAYHRLKFDRGYTKLIDILGPDHHGYINRLKAGVCALGHKKDGLSVIIIQLASLFRNAEPVAMSTRAGEYITLEELIKETGKGPARFFFLMRKCDAHLEFDLELAKKKSLENPVYYVQYAYARISGILALKDREKKSSLSVIPDFSLLKERAEFDLIAKMNCFSEVVVNCALNLEPLSLTVYLRELAGEFHTFYSQHKVISEDNKLTAARLALVSCAAQVISNGLKLLGIDAPKRM